jgi:hypothetical protein
VTIVNPAASQGILVRPEIKETGKDSEKHSTSIIKIFLLARPRMKRGDRIKPSIPPKIAPIYGPAGKSISNAIDIEVPAMAPSYRPETRQNKIIIIVFIISGKALLFLLGIRLSKTHHISTYPSSGLSGFVSDPIRGVRDVDAFSA